MQSSAEPDIASEPRAKTRLQRVDIARGIALIAMAIYHFSWDLEFFGYLAPATTEHGAWKLFARCIASSFLFLVGFSLVLAHGRGIRWRPMLIRLVQIAVAAAAITAVTMYITPESSIFFGILHEIALASLLGLLFLRLPAPLTLAVAALVIAAPLFARSEIFDHRILGFVGLATVTPRSNDYVPLFPWFGAVLIGIAAARILQYSGRMGALAGGTRPQALQRPLTFIGRHSLAFYLIHQPVLIGLVWLAVQIAPPDRRPAFEQSCVASCEQQGSEAMCRQFCGCVVKELDKAKLFDDVFSGKANQQNNKTVQGIVQMCSPVPDGQ